MFPSPVKLYNLQEKLRQEKSNLFDAYYRTVMSSNVLSPGLSINSFVEVEIDKTILGCVVDPHLLIASAFQRVICKSPVEWNCYAHHHCYKKLEFEQKIVAPNTLYILSISIN